MEAGIVGFTESEDRIVIDGIEYVGRILTPIYKSEEDKERTKSRIENALYNIFSKYMS